MKRTNTLLVLTISFLVSSVTLEAGKLKGKIVKSGDNGMISVSLNGNGGTSMSTGVSKAFSFNPNLGLEYSWGNFGLGFDVGTFSTKPNFDFNAYSAPLKGIDFLAVSGSSSSWRSTSLAFGPSYTFKIVKPIPSIGIVVKHNRPYAAITLSVKGGVTFNEAPDFSVVNNSTQKKIASYSPSTDYKKNALTIKPSVVFSYWFSENVAVSANVQYAMQTGQTEFTTSYKDLTNVSLAPPLSPDQFNKNISTAPNITSTTVGPDKYISFGVGLTYRFGKKGLNAVNVKASTEGSEQRKGWDGSIKGNVQSEKHYITIPHNLKNLKENESGISEISTNFAVGKHYITTPHNLKNKNENIPIDNTGGPANQVYGYGGPVVYDLCMQFLDAMGNEIEYGSGVCFINIVLCDEIGAITNGGSHVFIPLITEDLNAKPVNALLFTNTKDDAVLKGKNFNLKTDIQLSPEIAKALNCETAFLSAGNYFYNENNSVEVPIKMVGRKGWDGTVKGGSIQERGIDKKDVRKNESGQIVQLSVPAPKQTQGATFGEKVNAGRINVTLVKDGCIVLFPDNGFRVNTKEKTIEQLSQNDYVGFGEKVNAGLHAAGGALASGASLLGGALPGGAIISAAVSSVGNLSGGAGGGAAAASYAKTADKKKKKVWNSDGKDDNCDGLKSFSDGEYEFEFVIEERTSTASKKEQTRVIIAFSSISNVLKTKHDTAKNSVSNIR